jgi:transglutaminase-like putative cysteine protease
MSRFEISSGTRAVSTRPRLSLLGAWGGPNPMDFSAWFEVFLGERWNTFDARHNVPRIGRILMARGRDATDVAISTSFGPCQLTGFKVLTDEVPAEGESHSN